MPPDQSPSPAHPRHPLLQTKAAVRLALIAPARTIPKERCALPSRQRLTVRAVATYRNGG